MAEAYLLVPYERSRYFMGALPVIKRRADIDRFTAAIRATGGDWYESEVEGELCVVAVRADDAVMATLLAAYSRLTRAEAQGRIDLGRRKQRYRVEGKRDDLIFEGPTLAVTPLAELEQRMFEARAAAGAGGPTTALSQREVRELFVERYGHLPPVGGGAFPETALLDNFNRADATNDGATMSSGGTYRNPAKLFSSLATSEVKSNEWAGSGTWGQAVTTASYDRLAAGKDGVEVYVKWPTVGTGTDPNVNRRVYWGIADPNTTTPDGYWMSLKETDRLDNGGDVQLGAEWSRTLDAGDQIGVWHDNDAGGTIHNYENGTDFGTRTDTTYPTGHLAVLGLATDARADDFGGGEVVVAGGDAVPQAWAQYRRRHG